MWSLSSQCQYILLSCGLHSVISRLLAGGALVSTLCFCCFLAHRFLYGILVFLLFRFVFVCHTNLGDTMLSSPLVRQMSGTDQLITGRAGLWCLFWFGCFCWLCVFLGFCCLFFCLARWKVHGLCIDPNLFFCPSPLPFGGYAYSRTSRESNHHRQFVSAVMNDALPTEPRGHLDYVSIQFSSLLYAHSRYDWCCHCINSVNLQMQLSFKAQSLVSMKLCVLWRPEGQLFQIYVLVALINAVIIFVCCKAGLCCSCDFAVSFLPPDGPKNGP